MYFILPETEGCDLADIELYFADDKRKLTDRKIPKATENCYPVNKIDVEKYEIGQKTIQTRVSDVRIDECNNVRRTVNGVDNKAYLD